MTTAIPNHSINYFAPLASGGSCSVGQVMIPNSSDGTYYVVATTANRGTRGSEGVALSAWGGGAGTVGQVKLAQNGVIPASVSGLSSGYGSRALVRCSTTGSIERVASYTAGDDIIGFAEADGRVHLYFGFPWSVIATAAGVLPAGADKQLQYNNNGAFGGLPWTYEGAGEVRATDSDTQTVHDDTDAVNLTVWAHTWYNGAVDGNGGSALSIGSDVNGNLSSMPSTTFLWAKNAVISGLSASTSAFGIWQPGYQWFTGQPATTTNGGYVAPNFAILSAATGNTTNANLFGGGTGAFTLATATVEPSANPSNGVVIWTKPSNGEVYYRKMTSGKIRPMALIGSWAQDSEGQISVGVNSSTGDGWVSVYQATAGTETYPTASFPDGGLFRFSYYTADGPFHGDSVPIFGYLASTENSAGTGFDCIAMGISGGAPYLGDPGHKTETNIYGDGIYIDAGTGGGGAGTHPLTDWTGEIRLTCKNASFAGGFYTTNLSFHSNGAPGGGLPGVASFDGGTPCRLRTSLGTAYQHIQVNSGTTDIEWVSYFAAGSSPTGSGEFRSSLGVSTGDIISGNTFAGATAILKVTGNSHLQIAHETNWDLDIFAGNLIVWGKSAFTYCAGAGGAVVGRTNVNGWQFGAGSVDFGSGVGVLGIDNAGTNPTTNPTGGGILYADAGAGKWRGSGGTVTTFGPAEPHCPRCGTDVGVSQSENDIFGDELVHCHACELRTGNGVVRHFADFFERKAA